MTYLATTLPDDPAELGPWLDRIAAGGDAPRLADELNAIRGPATEPMPFPNDAVETVRRDGFAGLAPDQLRRVLADPVALIRLAEEALVGGGDYWNRVGAHGTAFDVRVEIGRRRLMAEVAPVAPSAAVRRRSYAPWLASLATAAALLMAFYLVPGLRRGPEPGPAASAAWGWQKAGDIDPATPPADYYARLADLADEWKTRDTATPLALALRINEFRAGCARLQLMEHKPLDDAQRKDLLARCQKWAKKFDANLAELETGGDAAKVRTAMDETAAQLGAALRDQSAKLRAG